MGRKTPVCTHTRPPPGEPTGVKDIRTVDSRSPLGGAGIAWNAARGPLWEMMAFCVLIGLVSHSCAYIVKTREVASDLCFSLCRSYSKRGKGLACGLVVELLSGMHEILGCIPSSAKEKEKRGGNAADKYCNGINGLQGEVSGRVSEVCNI